MPDQEYLTTKKRKIVADGVFKAELNAFLRLELAEAGYAGLEVRPTPTRTEVLIRATRSQDVIGERGRRIRELTKVVEKRFNFKPHKIELFVEKLTNRGLCAIAQAELLRYKLIGQVPVRRACNGIVSFIMDSGAQGCEVVVSGKISGQRAKSLKVVAGQMIHAGDACNSYVTSAFSYVELRQGVLGLKVRIMLPHDPTGKLGPTQPLPDKITVHEPKPEKYYENCYSESRIFTVEITPTNYAASQTATESDAEDTLEN